MNAYESVTDALRTAGMKVTESPAGARSQCPSHGSRSLSLAVRLNPKNPDGPLHVTCFAGCDTEDVLTVLGLGFRDLYDDSGSPVANATPRRPRPKPSPWDLIGDPEHFASRCLQQQELEADPSYDPHWVHVTPWNPRGVG